MSRPSKLTPDVQKKLLEAITRGNYIQVACDYAGIGTTTFYNWMRKGKTTRGGKYREFREAIKKAEAEMEMEIVESWREHFGSSWQAAATFLERRFPERWGRRRIEVFQTKERSAQMENAKESLLAKLEKLRSRTGPSNDDGT